MNLQKITGLVSGILLLLIILFNFYNIKLEKEEIAGWEGLAVGEITCFRNIPCNTCATNKVCFKYRINDTVYYSPKYGGRPGDLRIGTRYMVKFNIDNHSESFLDYSNRIVDSVKLFEGNLTFTGSCNCPED